MARTLRLLGFTVTEGIDITRSQFYEKWAHFLNEVEAGGSAAVFFAGHGVQLSQINFLLPADVPGADVVQELFCAARR